HLRVELLLDLQVFDDRFDDPVHFSQLVEIILQIAHGDQVCRIPVIQGRRLFLQEAILARLGQPVSHPGVVQRQALLLFFLRQFPLNDVQNIGGNVHVGQVSGDGGSHHSGTQHGGPFDLRHSRSSSPYFALPRKTFVNEWSFIYGGEKNTFRG